MIASNLMVEIKKIKIFHENSCINEEIKLETVQINNRDNDTKDLTVLTVHFLLHIVRIGSPPRSFCKKKKPKM